MAGDPSALPDYASYKQKGRGLTMEEIINYPGEMLTMTQISKVMGMHPSRLCYYADAKQLMFETQRSGNRFKVAKRVFLKAMGVEQ